MKKSPLSVAAVLLACALGAQAQLTRDAKSVPEAKSAPAGAPLKYLIYTTPDQKLFPQWMTKAEIKSVCPHCIVAILRAGEEPRYFDSIRTYDNFLVQDCANSAVVGAKASVDTTSPKRLCRETSFIVEDEVRSSHVAYDIWKDKNGVQIGMSVRFLTSEKGTSERAFKMVEEIAVKCPAKLRSMLRRYGIGFEADFLVIRNPSYFATTAKTVHPTITVDLVDAFGRANSGAYYYAGQGDWKKCATCIAKKEACAAGCKGDIGDEFCSTMAHELGHSLGLPDEYKDEDCPDRKFLSKDSDPWSLMDDHAHPWDDVELFPRHIAPIVAPLCKGSDAVIARDGPRLFLAYDKTK